MHPISDKELDKLFRQKFEEAEFQPSANLWDKISDKMDRKEKPKKAFPMLWMAASILVAVSVGLWFYRPVQVIKLQGSDHQIAANISEPVAGRAVDLPVDEQIYPEVKNFNFRKSVVTPAAVEITGTDEPVIEPQEPLEIVVAKVNPRRNSNTEAVAKTETKVPTRYYGDQSQLDVTQPDMIASAEIQEEITDVEPEAKPARRIKSIGSLVNFVIAKVDRRDDKLIEFKDSDEGSEVSGINLGLLKLKGRNR